jgi:hypothetical protein
MRSLTPVPGLVLSAIAAAQQATLPGSPVLHPAELRTPLRDGLAGAASFKATFGDGFAFYPFVGPDRARSAPLRWHTESVSVGTGGLEVLAAPAERAEDWRLTWDHGTWSEVYELRDEGVEQTFVLHTRPAGRGKAVIRGRIDSELRAPAVATAHQALVFADTDGAPMVRYGEAFAFDANGQQTPIATGFDGTHVTLTVPAEWLDAAAFPVTVDPLTTAVALATSPTLGAISSTDVAHDAGAGTRPLLFAFSRAFSARAHDAYGYVAASDFSSRVLIHARQNPAESDRNVTACYVAAANKWLIAYQNEYSIAAGRVATIRCYYHPANLTTLNPGNNWYIPAIGIQAFSNPDLGGTTAGNTSPRAILAYQFDDTNNLGNTDHSDIWVTQIDANTEQFLNGGYAAGSAVGSMWDRESPSVNQVAGSSDGWIVAYQERRSDTPGPWSVQAMRSNANALRIGGAAIVSSTSFQAVTPQVAGRAGNYLIAYHQTPYGLGTNQIRTVPVTWNPGAGTPASIGATQPVSGAAITMSVQSLAYDFRTASHWALAYTTSAYSGLQLRTTPRIVRLGGSGGVTEAQVLFSSSTQSGYYPGVTFNANNGQFSVVFATDETNDPLYGRVFEYPTTAALSLYGTGCGVNRITASPPFAGNENFSVTASLLPSPSTGILVMSLAPANISLTPVGMPGCFLAVDLATQLLVAAGTGSSAITWTLPLPDAPVVTGDLYFQALYVAPGANAANLLATRGLLAQVR